MARVEAVFALQDDMTRKLRSMKTAAENTERAVSGLDRAVDGLRRSMESATVAVGELSAALVELGKIKAVPEVGLDKSEFDRQFASVTAEVAALSKMKATIEVDVDRSVLDKASMASGGGIERALKKSGANTYFKSRNLLMFGVAGLIGGLIGLSGGLVAALEPVVPLLGATTSGILALGAGAGALLGVYKPLTTYFAKYQEISKAQAALDMATTDEERSKARMALADATSLLTAKERRLYDEQKKMKDQWKKLVGDKIEDRFYAIGASLMRLGRDMIPAIAPTIDKFWDVFSRLTAQMRGGLMNPQNASALRQALAPLPSLFSVLAQATGEFGRVIIGIGAGAGPEAMRIFKKIRDWLGAKADYLTSAKGIQHIKDYFALMAPITDKLVDSLANIGHQIAAISRVGREFAVPFLDAFDAVINALGYLMMEFTRVLGNSAPDFFISLSEFIKKITPGLARAFDVFLRVITKALDIFNSLPNGVAKIVTMGSALLLVTRRIPGLRTVLTLLRKIALVGAGKGLMALGGMLPGKAGKVLTGIGGGLGERGSSPANPLWVQMVAGPGDGPDVVGGGGWKGAAGKAGKLAAMIGAGGLGATAAGIGAAVGVGAVFATLLSGQGPFSKKASPGVVSARQAEGGRYLANQVLDENPELAKSPGKLAGAVLEKIKTLEPQFQTAAALGAKGFLESLEAKRPEATGATKIFLAGARTELDQFKTDVKKVMDELTAGRAAAATATNPMTNPPRRARGGVIASPQFSLIGERGPEAVIPLTNRTRRDQVMRESGMGSGGRKRAVASGPLVQISGVTINSGDDMQSFSAQLESAIKRALSNVPHADPEALLA